ncbi:MAG TPA: hypothetical protein V6C69_13825 [Trichormus sp.]
MPDQQKRYAAISKFVQSDELSSTVPFEFIPEGIKVHGNWYPVLKMQWVSGLTLGEFVNRNIGNNVAINLLATCFKSMTLDLRKYGIAHGDLQPDNIIISGDEIRLVDYDGMYVPELSGWSASELGHADYQHPRRGSSFFGPRLDNFSSWVIYTSLKALSRDASLWQRQNCGGDRLLFRRSDFENPDQSSLFKFLLNHDDEILRSCAKNLRRFLSVEPSQVPCLDWEIERAHSRPQTIISAGQTGVPTASIEQSDSGSSSRSVILPKWLKHTAQPAQKSADNSAGGALQAKESVLQPLETGTVDGAIRSSAIPPWLQSMSPEFAAASSDKTSPASDRQALRYGAHYLEAMKKAAAMGSTAKKIGKMESDDIFPEFSKIKLSLTLTAPWFEIALIESRSLMESETIRLSLDISTSDSGASVAVITNMRLIVARKGFYDTTIKVSSLAFAGVIFLERTPGLLKIHYSSSTTDPGINVSVDANDHAIGVLMDAFPEDIPRSNASFD